MGRWILAPESPNRWGGGAKWLYRKVDIYALRGYKTKAAMEALLQVNLDSVVLGDPGLLYGDLIANPPPKRYSIGIIPHHTEVDCPIFSHIAQGIPNSVLIDPHSDPMQSLQTIAMRETILSSAMHGLIIADGMGIPNKRLIATNRLFETQNGKFEDYYSVYELAHAPKALDIRDTLAYNWDSTVKNILQDYYIPQDKVQKIKQQLLSCFPFSRMETTKG